MAQSRDCRSLYDSHGRMDTSVTRLELSTGKETKDTRRSESGLSRIVGVNLRWHLLSLGRPFPALDQISALQRKRCPYHHPVPGDSVAVGASGLSFEPAARTLYIVRGEPIASNLQTFSLR